MRVSIKPLAILQSESVVGKALPFLSEKLWGSIRTAIAFIAGTLMAIGIGSVTPEGVETLKELLSSLYTNVDVLYSNVLVVIGEIKLILVLVSSWFSKK